MKKIYDPFENKKTLKRVMRQYPSLKKLTDIEVFEPLAWTGRVRRLTYNKEADLRVSELEGDHYIWKNPTDEKIKEEIQKYPKAEVSLGEKYDSRFPNNTREEDR